MRTKLEKKSKKRKKPHARLPRYLGRNDAQV